MIENDSRSDLEYTAQDSFNAILLNIHSQKKVVVVEGDDDKKFYKRHLNLSEDAFYLHVAKFCNYSKGRAIELARINQNVVSICAIIDADFDRITGNSPKDNNIISTDFHDLEMVIAMSDVFQKIIDFKVEEDLVKNLIKSEKSFKEFLLRKTETLSILRYLNLKLRWFIKFKKLSCKENGNLNVFFENGKFLSEDDCINTVLSLKTSRTPEINKRIVKKEMKEFINYFTLSDLKHLCNGKDLLQIAVYYLNRNLKGRRRDIINVESICTVYETRYIEDTNLFNKFNLWKESTI